MKNKGELGREQNAQEYFDPDFPWGWLNQS
jgi:hypothetical protein